MPESSEAPAHVSVLLGGACGGGGGAQPRASTAGKSSSRERRGRTNVQVRAAELLAFLLTEQHSRCCHVLISSCKPHDQGAVRAPSNCDLSFRICKCCLLQIAEHRPARMPVHSEMLGHAIRMRLALYCSPLGHSLFLPRDIVVTLHRMRAHTTLWSFLMPHCTPVRPRVATPGEMNMHFLPVSPGPSVLPIPTATAHPNLQQRWDASLLAVMQCIAAQRASTLEAQLPQINQCGLCVGLQTHHSCTRAGPHARAGVANRPSRDGCCVGLGHGQIELLCTWLPPTAEVTAKVSPLAPIRNPVREHDHEPRRLFFLIFHS